MVKLACGPLHSIALTNKGRLFGCGYCEKHALGSIRSKIATEFVELKVKHGGKIDKIEVGCSSTAYLYGNKAWVTGTIGDRVFENFSSISLGSEDIVDIKLT